jgi:hypothetical protein
MVLIAETRVIACAVAVPLPITSESIAPIAVATHRWPEINRMRDIFKSPSLGFCGALRAA